MTAEAAIPDREKSSAVLLAALVLSLLAHLALMFSLKYCSFSTFADSAARSRKWTRDLPQMHVTRHVGDPMAAAENSRGRPAAAPVVESITERVARLAEVPGRTIDVPRPEIAPVPEKSPDLPPPEIRAAENPKILDHPVALEEAPPRPIAAEARQTAFVGAEPIPMSVPTPVPVDEPAAVSMALAASKQPALPMPSGLGEGATGGDALGLDLAATAQMQVERELAAVKPASPASAPPREVPAAVMPKVDEATVAAEKQAVKKLRDEQPAKSVRHNVDCELAYWIDPNHRDFKYFRLRLNSSRRQPLETVPKDVVYLLDASGSIANDRLKSCRKAVAAAIGTLNSDDRFNVVAFRDRFTYLFDSWRQVDARSVSAANRWLNNLTAHGRTDVFATLRSVLAVPRDPARALIAMVITDGEATSGLTRSAEIISAFSELNDGLVAVYMYGVKESANAYLMDMLTRGSRGEWVRHDGYRWRAAAGIPELAARFADPVITDVAITFAAASRVDAYPLRPTHLYAGRPIDVYGVCPADTSRLVFSLRGLNGAQACQEVFTLDFDPRRQLDESVRTEWARRRLYALVEAYSKRPDPALMRDLKLFSRHYGVAIPYENELNKAKK